MHFRFGYRKHTEPTTGAWVKNCHNFSIVWLTITQYLSTQCRRNSKWLPWFHSLATAKVSLKQGGAPSYNNYNWGSSPNLRMSSPLTSCHPPRFPRQVGIPLAGWRYGLYATTKFYECPTLLPLSAQEEIGILTMLWTLLELPHGRFNLAWFLLPLTQSENYLESYWKTWQINIASLGWKTHGIPLKWLGKTKNICHVEKLCKSLSQTQHIQKEFKWPNKTCISCKIHEINK